MVEEMFKEAVRNKYRFEYRGLISTEDLWDLDVEDLDSIYRDLNSELKDRTEDSLLEPVRGNEELENKIEIVKDVVKTKLFERELKLKETERAEKKQRVLEILKDKQDESLKNKSEDELRAILDEL